MTNEEAKNVLLNAAWLGTDKERERIEKAVTIAVKAMETPDALKEIRQEIFSWHKEEPAQYVPNYDVFARCINLIDEKIEERMKAG